MKRYFGLSIILLFIFSNIYAQDEVEFFTKVGQKVPAFSFKTIEGKKYNIGDFKGKYVLINFFATWCGPCMKELPELESKIWQSLKKEDFIVITIGREHTVEELKKFNEEKNFSFLIAEDPGREIYSKFAPNTIPRNYILDKNGKILYQKTGYSETEFHKLVLLVKEFFKQE